MESLKKFARENFLIKKTFQISKRIVVAPLYLTSLKTLQLHNMPLLDLFDQKKLSLFKVAAPYTKAGYSRMNNVYELAIDIEEKKLEGAFVECGVWKGGLSGIMAGVAHRYGSDRTTWYFDSYEGMPPATPEDGTPDETDHMMGDYLRASVEDVEELVFEKLNLPREKNIIIKGWFDDTFPATKDKVGKISILRLDADWYEPTKLILETFYDQVISGGYIIFDDYGRWPGCYQATEEFLKDRNIEIKRHYLGKTGRRPMYFQKS